MGRVTAPVHHSHWLAPPFVAGKSDKDLVFLLGDTKATAIRERYLDNRLVDSVPSAIDTGSATLRWQCEPLRLSVTSVRWPCQPSRAKRAPLCGSNEPRKGPWKNGGHYVTASHRLSPEGLS